MIPSEQVVTPLEAADDTAADEDLWQTVPVESAHPAVTFDPTKLLDMVGGDSSLADALLEMVLVDMPTHRAQLEAAVEAANADDVRHVAHKMKGGLLSICGGRAGACAAALEQAGRAQKAEEFAPLLAELQRELAALSREISAFQTSRGPVGSIAP